MKVEVTVLQAAKNGLSLHDRLVAYLPAYAPILSRFSGLANLAQSLRRHVPIIAPLLERITGFTAKRDLPRWSNKPFRDSEARQTADSADAVILFADSFNRYFEPENLRAAQKVLSHTGKQVFIPASLRDRPVCCGRTYLSTGLVDKAREEARHLVDVFYPFAKQGIAIVGLEPSCTLALRDEVSALLGDEKSRIVAEQVQTFEEFLLASEAEFSLSGEAQKIYVHGHCHQKAFDVLTPVHRLLQEKAGQQIEPVETSCCGMAGAFGYGTDTYDISMKMAEANLLPKLRAAEADAPIIADGTSCRCQIADGSGRTAEHVAKFLADRL
jgi:Fe-S oxidoreductase